MAWHEDWTCHECTYNRNPEGNAYCGKCGAAKLKPAPPPTPEPVATTAPKKEKAKPLDLTRKAFLEKAKPITVKVGGSTLVAEVVEFSTGSFGWRLSGKAAVRVKGSALPVQVSLNLTVPGSKEAK